MRHVVNLILTFLFLAINAKSQARRIAVPKPVLFIYGYEKLTGKPQFWANAEQYRAEWDKTSSQVFNVIEGATRDASFVTSLRAQGKIFAYRVSNTTDEKHKTVDDTVAAWSKPFTDTLN